VLDELGFERACVSTDDRGELVWPAGASLRYSDRFVWNVGACSYAHRMPLTIGERQQFLAEPHIAALSVAGGAERAPLTVPMWYQYTPGGEAWVLTGASSTKAKLIQAAGRFTLMVDRVDPTLRYVMVEGPVTRMEPGTDEHLLEMSRRYLPAEAVPGYVEVARAEHGEQMVIHLRPERWLSADLGAVS
jgi:hypothetical protein